MPIARGTIKQGSSPNFTIIAPYTDPEGRHRQKWQTVRRRPGETDAQLHRRAEQELQELIVKVMKEPLDDASKGSCLRGRGRRNRTSDIRLCA